MISSYKNKKALLIGNGINQLDQTQSISWGSLLAELKSKFSIQVDLDNEFKPFPLGFEEMLHKKEGQNNFNSKLKTLKISIKNSIEEQLEDKVGYNEFHKKFMELNYDDILTTNYDYSLEKSIDSTFLENKSSLAKNRQERKYSLKRSYNVNNELTNIWHIHGELFDSRNLSEDSQYYNEESIMIGYEHYASYLEKIQENFKGKAGSLKVESQGLMTRIKNDKLGLFWTDVFFTHNLDIIGQGLDFSENHLWWLINQRAILMRNYNTKTGVLVDNQITFYYPKMKSNNNISIDKPLDEIIKKKNSFNRAKAVGELLDAFKVKTIGVECDSYLSFYEKLVSEYL